jgi:hypothetical protein
MPGNVGHEDGSILRRDRDTGGHDDAEENEEEKQQAVSGQWGALWVHWSCQSCHCMNDKITRRLLETNS